MRAPGPSGATCAPFWLVLCNHAESLCHALQWRQAPTNKWWQRGPAARAHTVSPAPLAARRSPPPPAPPMTRPAGRQMAFLRHTPSLLGPLRPVHELPRAAGERGQNLGLLSLFASTDERRVKAFNTHRAQNPKRSPISRLRQLRVLNRAKRKASALQASTARRLQMG
jgi:hypothetical protein